MLDQIQVIKANRGIKCVGRVLIFLMQKTIVYPSELYVIWIKRRSTESEIFVATMENHTPVEKGNHKLSILFSGIGVRVTKTYLRKHGKQ